MYGLRERRRLPPKTYWVTYGLQRLSTEKFSKVVQKILDGEHILLRALEIDLEEFELNGDSPLDEKEIQDLIVSGIDLEPAEVVP